MDAAKQAMAFAEREEDMLRLSEAIAIFEADRKRPPSDIAEILDLIDSWGLPGTELEASVLRIARAPDATACFEYVMNFELKDAA